jgi:hypothetical protein
MNTNQTAMLGKIGGSAIRNAFVSRFVAKLILEFVTAWQELASQTKSLRGWLGTFLCAATFRMLC